MSKISRDTINALSAWCSNNGKVGEVNFAGLLNIVETAITQAGLPTDREFLIQNLEGIVKQARAQCASYLNKAEGVDFDGNISLGALILASIRKAERRGKPSTEKLQEQFSHGKLIAFIADRRDTCKAAITKLLKAEGCLTSAEIFERLRIIYDERWSAPTMRTTLSQLAADAVVGKTPGQTRTLYYI